MFRKFEKGLLSLLLAFLLLIGVLPGGMTFGLFEADAAELEISDTAANITSGSGTWISGKLTYSYSVATLGNGTSTSGATGSVSANSTTLTVKATSAKEYSQSSGCSSTTYTADGTTTTVTVTNASSYPLKINTLTPGGKANVTGVSQGDTIAPGATFTVTVTSQASGTSNTEQSGTVNISVEEQTNVVITLASSPYTDYTINGITVAKNGSSQTFSVDAGASVSLPTLNSPAGYDFKGWRVGSNLVTGSSFTADAGYTVFPVFVTAGTDTTSANFKVGSNTYTFWEDAVTAAAGSSKKTIIVNRENVTLPSKVLDNLLPEAGGTYVKPKGDGVEYILPSSITLLIPFDSAGTLYTATPAVTYNAYETPTAFRTLTMSAGTNITVKSGGAISLGGKLSSKGQLGGNNGTPTGPDGRIHMHTGSNITLENGASLYAWGYIYGSGLVEAESGSTVYEAFQVKDWRGGSATSDIYKYAFIFSQYYIQNIEVPLKINSGANEKLYSSVNASSSAYPIGATLVGDGGLFRLTSGYLIKDYNENKDRIEYNIYGTATISAMTITGIPMIGSISTSDYILPINGNMTINVESGTTTISQNMELLPGGTVSVQKNATVAVGSGKKVYLYDVDDWGNYTGSAKLYVVGYSVANGTTAIRTASNLEDAHIDVNGTFNVNGSLFTSNGGADIMSSQGYDGTNGKLVFSTAPTASATIYEMANNSTKTSVTMTAPKLHNGDDSYSATAGTGTSTWKYDKDGEHWYRYLVNFQFNNHTISTGFFCENGATVTYDASWLTNLGASASNGTATVSGTNVNVTGVTADSDVTLTGTPAEYIPTFVLNDKQYSLYRLYTGNTISNTTTINGDTYYIVDQASSALMVGSAYAAPTDVSMGVTSDNHNDIIWNLSGGSFTSGNAYRGIVPAGATVNDPVYIYGFYDGYIAHVSYQDTYYRTLNDAFSAVPTDQTATITLLADCGSFEEESGGQAHNVYPEQNITLDLNGHHALGRINNNGTFTLELNGGVMDYHTGATAAAAAYRTFAAISNSGTLTVQDTAGGGKVTTDVASDSGGANNACAIRNNGGNAVIGAVNIEMTQLLNANNSVVMNYNGGVMSLNGTSLSSGYGYNVFNYGATIDRMNGLTMTGSYGINNRNLRGGALASGYTVTKVGTITDIDNCDINVGQYAVYNGGKITTVENSTFVAHPDSAQVDTLGNGSAARHGNVQCYTVFNSNVWWYDTNVWKQVDSSSGGYTRVNYYKEEEAYRPSIGTITDCEIYAENTSTSASHGYALVNYGVINKIGGTTNIKTYKHTDNTKISTSHYALHNLNGGIIKSIEGAVNVSATGVGTVYNDGVFTTQINYTYGNKVGGNITYQKNIYGQPSEITSVTCSGTWSCGSGSGLYYALMNSGHIGTINSTGLTLEGGYNVLYNATGGVNATYEITKKYTDAATASTEYEKNTSYVKNLEKGSTIDTINGITINVKGTKVYQGLNNQGHIGTLSNVNVGFASGATNNTSGYALVLNGDSRYQSYTETIRTNRTAETDPHLTVTAGVVTRYDRDYTYTTPPTIDTIDNLTVTSIGTYAFRNAGAIGTLKNSTITGTQYALQNYANGPYTERQTIQYYSGASIFATNKYTGELWHHYKRNPATINTIDNCTITTPANSYAMLNTGHVGTIKNSTLQAGTTTAKAYALANLNSHEREATYNLEELLYVTANTTSSCTAYYGTNGESKVIDYDYDAPSIDLIGEGNTFKATSTVIANTGIITEINSGTGTLTTVTGSSAKGSSIYNYGACLDTRTATTPYTAATAANASGTAGTVVNSDTLLSGAQIGTIKNVYINANGYGILNGDAGAGKTPTIGEIGEGTEVYAHCTTAGYHAIYNQANAKVASITGGVYTTTKATTNAYKNNNTAADKATLISGGDFKGMAATRANAIFEPDNTNRQTYPEGKKLSTNSRSVSFNNGTTTASGTGYYYIASNYTVSFNANGHGTAPADQTIEQGQKATKPADPSESGWVFGGWYKEAAFTNAWNFTSDTVHADTELFAKWTKAAYTVSFNMQGHGTAPDAQTIDQGQKVTKPADPTADGYRFDGWYKEAACTNAWNFSSDTVSANTTLFAKWTKLYTITWKNSDGTLIDTTVVASGVVPTHADAEKASTAQYDYTFTGWTPAVTAASGDKTYTATYSQSVRSYTITWKLHGGDQTTSVPYDEVPSYEAGGYTDGIYTYSFTGWDIEPVKVTGEATYTAQYQVTGAEEYEFFTSHSLTLDGSIGMNFFITLPAANSTATDYTVDLTFYKSDENITGMSLDDAGWTGTQYKVRFPVDAPEMTDDVTAILKYQGLEVDRDTFKAAQYASAYSGVASNGDTAPVEGSYYLVGTIMGNDCWPDDSKPNRNVNPEYKLTENPNQSGEYMLENVELMKGDKIKVIQYRSSGDLGWYPNGSGNDYIVGEYVGTAGSDTGVFTVYMNPTNDYNTQGSDWDARSDKKIYVAPKENSASLLPSLVRAMLNYGSKAQVNFKHNQNDLADSSAYIPTPNGFGAVTDDMINTKLNVTEARDTSADSYKNAFAEYGLTYAGHSLVMNSNTRMRFYFTFGDGFDLDTLNQNSFTIDGKEVDAVWGNSKKTMIYFEVSGIEAANLDKEYVLSDGTHSIGYCALDYVRLMLKQSSAPLRNLGQALYWYNYYADLYFDAVAKEQA